MWLPSKRTAFIVLAISAGVAGLVWGISGFKMGLDYVLAWVISLWLTALVLVRLVLPFVQLGLDVLVSITGSPGDDEDA